MHLSLEDELPADPVNVCERKRHEGHTGGLQTCEMYMKATGKYVNK